MVYAATTNSCSIQLSTDVKGFAPIILTDNAGSDFQLFKPTGDVTYLPQGTQLQLVCTGNKNFIESTNEASLELKCSKGSFVDANNNAYELSELVCKSIPSSSLRITAEECSNGNGYIYQTGFNINNQFYGPVFEICYSNVTENTFYTHNTLNGAAMDSKYILYLHIYLTTMYIISCKLIISTHPLIESIASPIKSSS